MISLPKLPKLPKWELKGTKLPELPDPRKTLRRTAKYYGVGQGIWGKWAQKTAPTRSNGGKG